MAGKVILIPEVIYFATYMAINDRRLYDREWFRIKRLMESANFGDEVREKAMAIIGDLPEKLLLDDIIDTLCTATEETRAFTLYFGLLIAYEDGTFRDKEEVLFLRLCKRFKIDKKRYAKIQKDAKDEIAREQASTDGRDAFLNELNSRYDKALFSGSEYDEIARKMQAVAEEDLKVSTDKIEKTAELFLVAPKILKDQQEKVLRYEGRLNDSEEKKQLEQLFSTLREKEETMLKEAEKHPALRSSRRNQQRIYRERFGENHPL